jgi:hypothetical protein
MSHILATYTTGGASFNFGGVVMSQSQASSVIRPLESVRERVKQRLMQVPEYRAFLAMEKPIGEVENIPDLVAHLQTAQQKILERLAVTKEYQALLTVEKAIQDLSQVLEVVGDDGNRDDEPSPSKGVSANEESADIASPPVPEPQHPIEETAAAAIATTPTVAADEIPAATLEAPSQDAAKLVSSVETADEQGGKPTVHLSTLGLVEEWRLTAMVRESFSTSGGDEGDLYAGEGSTEADRAKVA